MDSNKILDMITHPEKYDHLFVHTTKQAQGARENVSVNRGARPSLIRKAGECVVPGTAAERAERMIKQKRDTINQKRAQVKRRAFESVDCDKCSDFMSDPATIKVLNSLVPAYRKHKDPDNIPTSFLRKIPKELRPATVRQSSLTKDQQDVLIALVKGTPFTSKATEAIARKHAYKLMPRNAKATEDVDSMSEQDFDAVNFEEDSLEDMFDEEVTNVLGDIVDETDEEPEHIRVSFTLDEDKDVVLKVFGDSTITQVVNADIVEPAQFTAEFVPTEDEDGNLVEGEVDLILNPIIDEEDEDTEVMSEEDSVPDSEEDNDTYDEGGNTDSEEYVDPAGLNMDDDYSRKHNIKPARNAGVKQPQKAPVSGVEKRSIYRR